MRTPLPIAQVIQSLKSLRVRQGENHVALSALAQQAELLLGDNERISATAADIKNHALQLKRAGASVPRFVVQDLLEESIERLQQVQLLSSALDN